MRSAPVVEFEVPAEVPDWSREKKRIFSWHPSRVLLASIRSYQRHVELRNSLCVLVMKRAVLRHRFWSVVTGADIPLNCQIGGVAVATSEWHCYSPHGADRAELFDLPAGDDWHPQRGKNAAHDWGPCRHRCRRKDSG